MGYRSNVVILTKENQFNAMVMGLTGTEAEDYFEAIDTTRVFVGQDGTRYVRVDWTDIKWYDDTILYYLRGLDDEVYWEYMRVGEDYDDVECDANVPRGEDWRLYCYRDIRAGLADWEEV